MAIIIQLDRLLVERKLPSNELAHKIDLSENNLSRIKTGKIKAIRFSTLNALCRELKCKPGDILDYIEDDEEEIGD